MRRLNLDALYRLSLRRTLLLVLLPGMMAWDLLGLSEDVIRLSRLFELGMSAGFACFCLNKTQPISNPSDERTAAT